METANRIHTVRERVAAWRVEGHVVGFVPTMGNLHKGHLSLVEEAFRRAARVVVSVFVNPLQFSAGEDFDRYPRTLERDRDLLVNAGVQLLFAPAAFEIYPLGTDRTAVVDVPELGTILEGQVRPGHFAGVATVVAKLLNIVQPDVAVFGEKDFQQLTIIQRMVRDLSMPVEIVPGPIVRDPDGLALSSRNQYLSVAERHCAPGLYAALRAAKKRIQDGERRFDDVEADGMRQLVQDGFKPDYFSIRRAHDLLPPREGDPELVILAAARLGKTRLIDNLQVRV